MRSSAVIFGLVSIAVGASAGAQTYPAAGYSPPAFQDTATPPAGLPSATPAQDATLPVPVYSRVANFTIPFSVAQQDKQSLEVLLFVSHDYGANWVLYGRQPATLGQFPFRTRQDGEYWFASRIHPLGTVVSAGATFRPELRVIVDSVEPRLDVQALVSPGGEIQVEWRAIDDQIAPETLTIEYQEAIGRPYRAVPSAPGQQLARNTVAGTAAWKPEAGSYFVSIRIQIQDRAGNSAEAIRRLILPVALNSRPPTASGPAPAAPEATAPPDPFSSYGMPGLPASPPPSALPPEVPATQEVQRPAASAVPEPTAWPSEEQHSSDVRREPFSPQYTESAPDAFADPNTAADNRQGGDQAATPSKSDAQRSRTAGTVEARAVASSRETPVEGVPRTRDASPDSPPSESSRPSPPASVGGLPTGERPRMTASKRFNLDYSVDAVGPAGVEKVELWVTRNGGRDWDLGWVDEDRESPLLVEVDDEGIFGFRLVIVGKNGLASQMPRPGDLADLWIGVDTTNPMVEITSAAYGSDDHAGQLDIRWSAADQHLANRPVTLSFSAQQDGPWTTIAAGLPNTGQYYWRVDSRVPAQFYLRIEVRDEAGNVAAHRLDQPLQSAGLTPRASIRGFVPAGQ